MMFRQRFRSRRGWPWLILALVWPAVVITLAIWAGPSVAQSVGKRPGPSRPEPTRPVPPHPADVTPLSASAAVGGPAEYESQHFLLRTDMTAKEAMICSISWRRC